MTSKIEARRFAGKASTWNHYAMAVKAHFAVAKLTKYFNDGSGIAANQKGAWREAQVVFAQGPVMVSTFCSARTWRPAIFADQNVETFLCCSFIDIVC